jgi:hypothetical protein
MSSRNNFHKLSDLVILIAENLIRIENIHERKVTRMLTELFDVLLRLEHELTAILGELASFQNENRIGWRVHYIHNAGLHFTEFNKASWTLCRWISHNAGFLTKAEVFTTEMWTDWDSLDSYGYTFGRVAYKRVEKRILFFCDKLQANKSPDPKLFPPPETVEKVSDELGSVLSQYSAAKQLVREFAIARLTVEDFF